MKVLKQIDPKTRIVVKRFHFPAYGTAIVLQRKGHRRWKNKAWSYNPTLTMCKPANMSTPEFTERYLLWEENRKNRQSQYDYIVELFEGYVKGDTCNDESQKTND